jgi:hypothetical protein
MPPPTIVTTVPDTVHTAGVVEAKPTVSPEVAVAVSVKGAIPNVTLPTAGNEISCEIGLTAKLWVTGFAAEIVPPFPGWVAVMEQVPTAIIVTVFPETVHTRGVVEAKLTGSPELAVALMVNGGVPITTLGRVGKVMLCPAIMTVKLCVTGDAAK